MRLIRHVVLCLILALAAAGCTQEAPITGRKQLALIPSSQLNTMAHQQYLGFLRENKKSNDKKKIAMVRRVGDRLRKAVEAYFAQEGLADNLADYEWRFELVENDQKNAWAMPGGRVVVYTGILDVTKDDTGLAVVLGHEIAHAVAEHGRERMSQQLLVTLGGIALSQAVKDKPSQTRALFLAAYGAGSAIGVLLPYSRIQEKEADQLGLYFMAMAGYDPRKAPAFWQRMSESKSGAPPEFLSTHPADATRIRRMNEHMPEAMKYYRESGGE